MTMLLMIDEKKYQAQTLRPYQTDASRREKPLFFRGAPFTGP